MSRKTTLIPKRIAQIRFSLMDPVEIRKMSSVEVKTPDTYKDDGHAYRQGLMDPHMGVIEPGLVCPTDNCKYDESPGHFGHIQLELPVIHIGFVNLIKTALKSTCKACSNVLFTLRRKRTRPILNFPNKITTVLVSRISSPSTVLVRPSSQASSRKLRRLHQAKTAVHVCTVRDAR